MQAIHRARSNSTNSQESWTLAERIRLLELFTRELLWDNRADEMMKEFGSSRPQKFFTARSCKDELNRIFNQPNPEHVNTGLPAHPRGKEAAEMWLKHFKKESERKREEAKQMLRVRMRKNLDLVMRFKEGKLPMEELMALRDHQYELDSERADAEKHERGVQKIISQTHAEDITNVNTLEDLLRIFRGERVLKGSELPPPPPKPAPPLSPPIRISRPVEVIKEAVKPPTTIEESPIIDVHMTSPVSSPKQIAVSPERVKSPIRELKRIERPSSISGKTLLVSASPGQMGISLRIRSPPMTPQSVSRSPSLVTMGTPPRTTGVSSPAHIAVPTSPIKEEIDLNSPPSSGLRSHTRTGMASPPRIAPSSPVSATSKAPKTIVTQTPVQKSGPLTRRARLLSSDTDGSETAEVSGIEPSSRLKITKKKEIALSSAEPVRRTPMRSPPKEIDAEPEKKSDQDKRKYEHKQKNSTLSDTSTKMKKQLCYVNEETDVGKIESSICNKKGSGIDEEIGSKIDEDEFYGFVHPKKIIYKIRPSNKKSNLANCRPTNIESSSVKSGPSNVNQNAPNRNTQTPTEAESQQIMTKEEQRHGNRSQERKDNQLQSASESQSNNKGNYAKIDMDKCEGDNEVDSKIECVEISDREKLVTESTLEIKTSINPITVNYPEMECGGNYVNLNIDSIEREILVENEVEVHTEVERQDVMGFVACMSEDSHQKYEEVKEEEDTMKIQSEGKRNGVENESDTYIAKLNANELETEQNIQEVLNTEGSDNTNDIIVEANDIGEEAHGISEPMSNENKIMQLEYAEEISIETELNSINVEEITEKLETQTITSIDMQQFIPENEIQADLQRVEQIGVEVLLELTEEYPERVVKEDKDDGKLEQENLKNDINALAANTNNNPNIADVELDSIKIKEVTETAECSNIQNENEAQLSEEHDNPTDSEVSNEIEYAMKKKGNQNENHEDEITVETKTICTSESQNESTEKISCPITSQTAPKRARKAHQGSTVQCVSREIIVDIFMTKSRWESFSDDCEEDLSTESLEAIFCMELRANEKVEAKIDLRALISNNKKKDTKTRKKQTSNSEKKTKNTIFEETVSEQIPPEPKVEPKMEDDEGKRKKRKKSTTVAEPQNADVIVEAATGVQLRKRKRTEPTTIETVLNEEQAFEAPPAKNLRSSDGSPLAEIAAASSPPRPSQPVMEPHPETTESEALPPVTHGRRASTRIQVQRKASLTAERIPSDAEVKKEPEAIETIKIEAIEQQVEPITEYPELHGVSTSTQTDVSVHHVLQPILVQWIRQTRSKGLVQTCSLNVGSQTDQVEFAPDDIVYVKQSSRSQPYELPIKVIDLEAEINKPAVKRTLSKFRLKKEDKDTVEAIAMEHRLYDTPAAPIIARPRTARPRHIIDIDENTATLQQVEVIVEEPEAESDIETKDDDSKRKPTRTQPTRESAKPGAVTKQLLITLLKQIQTLRDAAIFMQPVNERDVPGYHAVVNEPMDLAKIKRMIEAGSIETLLQLKDHTLLMFTNAIMFNTTGHHVNQAAKDLLRQSAKILREAQYAAGELSDLSPSPKSRRSAITSIMSARAMRSGIDTPKLNSVTVSHSPTPSDISTTEQGSFLAPAARATPPAQKMPRSRFGMPPTLRANSSEPTEAEDANAKRRIFGRKLLQNSVYKIPAPKSNI